MSGELVTKMALGLVLARAAAELFLAWLNRRHAQQRSMELAEPWTGLVEPAVYRKSVEYTLAKNSLSQVETFWGTVALCVILFSGVLPASHNSWTGRVGAAVWSEALFVFCVATALSLLGLPLDWYAQFRLEQRFGFNTTTQKLWWLDRLKGMILAFALGYPLLLLLLKWATWAATSWWFWGWATLVAVELLLIVLAPKFILPLFNRFSPLPEGPLRERLFALARKTSFIARQIEVMDGSKRSRHSNAFFTGLGKFRKIVLFDTLLQQLSEPEIEAVLAHEIGHFKKRHIMKLLLVSSGGSLAGFYVLFFLAGQAWFYEAFGFLPGNVAIAFLLFFLLGSTVGFWTAPLRNLLSRHYEYEADGFAAIVLGESDSLRTALRKLHEENLSNLFPHPLFSAVYYSHPTFLERDAALKRWPKPR